MHLNSIQKPQFRCNHNRSPIISAEQNTMLAHQTNTMAKENNKKEKKKQRKKFSLHTTLTAQFATHTLSFIFATNSSIAHKYKHTHERARARALPPKHYDVQTNLHRISAVMAMMLMATAARVAVIRLTLPRCELLF